MWCNINSWLIDQVHKKKSINKRGKYILTDDSMKYYYDSYLYKDKNQLSSMDTFPSKFKAYLEDLLVKDLTTKRFNYIEVYYRHEEKPNKLRYDDFDKNEWSLSEGLQMTPMICI